MRQSVRYLLYIGVAFGLILVVGFFLSWGCAKSAMEEAMTPPTPGAMPMKAMTGGPGGGGAMGGGMEAPTDEGKEARMEAEAVAREYQVAQNSAVPPEAPGPTAAMASHRRKVIMAANLAIEVEDVEEKGRTLARLVEEMGGFIASSSLERGYAGRVQATVTMRLPQENFERAIERIKALGRVQREQLSGEDVTAQFVDLQARLKSA